MHLERKVERSFFEARKALAELRVFDAAVGVRGASPLGEAIALGIVAASLIF
ncbi:hypothetical protein [Tolypothrix sp. LEGE 11397]|uniref:hypothetical protein n=1 Tax=Tolypothrix sp. LEGE 11397 TaxID=2777971 RepID=UPI00187F23E4